MAKKKISKKQRVYLDDLLWSCGDCGNVYSLDIRFCPNNVLDQLIVNKVIDMEECNGC